MADTTTPPRTLDDITADWLSDVLATPVTSVTTTRIAEGEGFMGKLARVVPTYGDGGAGPPSLVAKLPTDDPGGQAIGQLMRLWEREARFYREVAPTLPVRTPACAYAGGDPSTGLFTVVLEDLGGLVAGDQVAGATEEQAAAAVEWLARFHASFAGRTDDPAVAWLPAVRTDPMYQALQGMLEGVWPGFRATFEGSAPAQAFEWVDRSIPHLTESLVEERTVPTIIHSDFRVDNLFFAGPAVDDVVVIDWQAAALGQPLYDLAYFLCGSVDTDLRRRLERTLVSRYREVAIAAGADLPGDGELWDLYREMVLVVMLIGTFLMGQLDFTVNERAGELARLGIARMYTAGVDLGVDEFIRG